MYLSKVDDVEDSNVRDIQNLQLPAGYDLDRISTASGLKTISRS
jgi:hypothetical protein